MVCFGERKNFRDCSRKSFYSEIRLEVDRCEYTVASVKDGPSLLEANLADCAVVTNGNIEDSIDISVTGDVDFSLYVSACCKLLEIVNRNCKC